jgi:hypothetical protein
MSPFIYYFRPQILETISAIMGEYSTHEKPELLEPWLQKTYPDVNHQNQLRDLLEKIGAVEFGRYCGEWFTKFSFAFDTEGAIVIDDDGDQVFESFIMITEPGKRFIQSLFKNYIKPTL